MPPYGIHWPAKLAKVIDGDTIAVTFPGRDDAPVRIRLLNCWAPERNTPEGQAAKRAAEQFLEGREISVLMNLVPKAGESLLKQLTFDRVVGVVYIHGRGTLNDLMVQAGAAAPKKQR
jgi:endonuclease YncB( thermonuclease family)